MPGPAYHARTHLPGGTDPLQTLAHGWIRRRQLVGTQAIPSGSNTAPEWDDTVNNYTDLFDTTDEFDIKVLEDGLYSILVRLFWDSWPGEHSIVMNGIDPDDWGTYGFGQVADQLHTLTSTAAMDARLGADEAIFPHIHHTAGTDKDLYTGTYFEVRYLGPCTVTDRAFFGL